MKFMIWMALVASVVYVVQTLAGIYFGQVGIVVVMLVMQALFIGCCIWVSKPRGIPKELFIAERKANTLGIAGYLKKGGHL